MFISAVLFSFFVLSVSYKFCYCTVQFFIENYLSVLDPLLVTSCCHSSFGCFGCLDFFI